jgi:DNA-binding winged helix-turn-helix (wHTH) protein
MKTYSLAFSWMFILVFSMSSVCFSQEANEDRQTLVTMRMIGHELLLSLGDSTSRVLPIEKEADTYRISFESDFEFDPNNLVLTVDSVMLLTGESEKYLVEVESCETQKIVYSFQVGNIQDPNLVPCRGREQPAACYSLLITLLDTRALTEAWIPPTFLPNPDDFQAAPEKLNSTVPQYLVLLPLLGLFAYFLFFFWKRSQNQNVDTNLISIGAYTFDKRNMELSYNDEKIELTSKEADLLDLLHNSANNTLEREVILKKVWGDEGDYVGRTLDVFISKLRKKLGADTNLKIVNIRGIGYKFVMNGVR